MRGATPKVLGTLVALFLAGCQEPPGRLAGGGATEETNGSLAGCARNPDGLPAVGARIAARTQGYLQDTSGGFGNAAEYRTVADSAGRFRIDSLPPGAYIVEIRDHGGFAGLAPAQVFAGRREELPPLGLGHTGSLIGTLELPPIPGHAAYVRVYGLDRIARADSSGRYVLPDLPRGSFRIDAVSSAPGLGYAGIRSAAVLSGSAGRLPTLRLVDFLAEDYSAWPRSRRLHVDARAGGVTEPVPGFPLLLRLDAAVFDFGASEGRDIRFSTVDGRHLPYEIEQWDASGKRAAIWVRLDTLRIRDEGQSLVMHWGLNDVPDFSSGPSVFPEYGGVWHLRGSPNQAGTFAYPDASPATARAEGMASPRDTGNAAGGAAHFQDGRSLLASGHPGLRPEASLSLSAWFKLPLQGSEAVAVAALGDDYGLRINPDGGIYAFLMPDTTRLVDTLPRYVWKIFSTKGIPVDHRDGEWHHGAMVYDGSRIRLYADGVELASTPFREALAYAPGSRFHIGAHAGGIASFDFLGELDEVRMSGNPWSASRLRAEFLNQQPGSTWVEFR